MTVAACLTVTQRNPDLKLQHGTDVALQAPSGCAATTAFARIVVTTKSQHVDLDELHLVNATEDQQRGRVWVFRSFRGEIVLVRLACCARILGTPAIDVANGYALHQPGERTAPEQARHRRCDRSSEARAWCAWRTRMSVALTNHEEGFHQCRTRCSAPAHSQFLHNALPITQRDLRHPEYVTRQGRFNRTLSIPCRSLCPLEAPGAPGARSSKPSIAFVRAHTPLLAATREDQPKAPERRWPAEPIRTKCEVNGPITTKAVRRLGAGHWRRGELDHDHVVRDPTAKKRKRLHALQRDVRSVCVRDKETTNGLCVVDRGTRNRLDGFADVGAPMIERSVSLRLSCGICEYESEDGLLFAAFRTQVANSPCSDCKRPPKPSSETRISRAQCI